MLDASGVVSSANISQLTISLVIWRGRSLIKTKKKRTKHRTRCDRCSKYDLNNETDGD